MNRNTAKYRMSRHEASVERLCVEHGFTSVDPSELSAMDELAMFLNAEALIGLFGSQVILGLMRPASAPMLLVSHDQVFDDSRGIAWVNHELSNASLGVVAGLRDDPVAGRSQQGFHQDFALSDRGYRSIGNWLRDLC
jgi:capsular polysaccharide biosynthesis protein